MAQPKPLRTYDATPARKDAAQNQRVLHAVQSMIEDMLVAGRYGSIELTVKVQDGILVNDMVVTYTHRIKA